jgi:ferric-dicitrate binding protein FerR (iron transport regulator)
MKKRNTHIDWRIFRKATTSQLNQKEQEIFDLWLEEDSNRRNYFNKARRYYQSEHADSGYDYQPAFSEFISRTKIKKRNYLRFTQIAASIIIVLACSWLAYVVVNTKDYQPLSDAKPIQAKEGDVELVLSSGKKVLLKKEGEHEIKEKEGAIQKRNGVVDYLAYKNQKSKYTQYNTVNVPRGTNFKLVLSDSTVVTLNAESSITYPLQFADNIREVRITGEAYFQVKKNKSKAFVVESNGTKVKVLGTEFNVDAYKTNEGVFTTLVEGSVAVSNEFGKSVIIKPNEQATTSNNANIQVREVDVNRIIAWRKGMLDFEDEPLGDIMEGLARWYDFKVFYELEELKHYEFTGAISQYEDVNELLRLFEMTKSVQFYIKGDVLLVKKAE